ncbi:hypothetical protein RQP46_007689 [Phenoliferia psychrophenolica]
MSISTSALLQRVPPVSILGRVRALSPASILAIASIPLGALTFRALRASYQDYLSNGPGGVGQHVMGWAQVWGLRFLIWAPLPQRHVVDQQDELLGAAEMAVLTKLAEDFPTKVNLRQSHLEAFGPGLFAAPAVTLEPGVLTPTHAREFAHIHLAPFTFPTPLPRLTTLWFGNMKKPEPNDTAAFTIGVLPGPQSAHVTLSPRDAITVIQKGWGVRHPASGKTPPGVPNLAAGYVLVYAPRGLEELEVFRSIVEASAGFVTGIKDPIA